MYRRGKHEGGTSRAKPTRVYRLKGERRGGEIYLDGSKGKLFQVFVYHIKTCASKDEKDRAKCAMVAIIHYRRTE